MILYVNGDSHTAAAEAVNSYAFAEDDGRLTHLGRLPHPDNIRISWGKILADTLKYSFKCDAESASSNHRIIRTTRAWAETQLSNPTQALAVIQWSTWERDEWLIDGKYYQINASGIDDVPDGYQTKYKEFVANVDWQESINKAHEEIWQLHKDLTRMGITHIFFNGNMCFTGTEECYDWGNSYIGPYNKDKTFDSWLKSNNYQTVSPASWHFGQDAHSAWSQFVLQYIINHKLVK
jgi:hypothetical protein